MIKNIASIVKSVFLVAIVILLLSCDKSNKNFDFSAYEDLSTNFKDPQGTARAKVYWWWLNGNVDTTRMKTELHAIKNAGLGGVNIFEIGVPKWADPQNITSAGPAFMGDESLDIITMAIKEATKLGLEVDFNLSSSWNAGGSWTLPQHAAKSLYFTKIKINGKENREIKLPFPNIPKTDEQGKKRLIEFTPNGKPVYYEEVAVLAIPAIKEQYLDTAKIVNISAFFNAKTETLKWNVPEGEWEILRYVCSNSGEQLKLPSPNSMGPIIDHFDAASNEVHFMFFIDKLKSRLGNDFTKTALKSFYLASFEASQTAWTSSLPSEFKKHSGYDIYKFLPYVFDKNSFSPEITKSFSQDFNITISELMINNHYGKGREISNKYGLNLISESGGPGPPLHNVPVDGIKALGTLNVPRGEFWINHSRYDGTADSIDLVMLVKEVSAASNLYQRKIAELEAFTSFQNWMEGPGDMKPIGDRSFAEGMNRVVIHGFTHNPGNYGYPGIVYHAGTHYNDKITWWSKSKPFNDYLARISYILQETDFTADVLYYYGEQVPNFVTSKNTRFAVGSGYDYEVIDTENLLNALTVEDGVLTLPYGAKFKVLALGDIIGKNKAILSKLDELLKQGAIITGVKPDNSTVNQLWTSEAFSAKSKEAKIYTTPVLDILKSLSISPDFDYPDKQSSKLSYQNSNQPVLDYIHYKKGDLDFYFVRNTRNQWISRNCSFRQQDKSPEIWDPVTGDIITVNVYNQSGDYINVPLCFAPYGSYFIVFGPKTTPDFSQIKTQNLPRFEYLSQGIQFLDNGTFTLDGKTVTNKVEPFTITGSWDITFDEKWGAPGKVNFPELISWTDSPVDGIKYYSGTAVYTKSFTYNKPSAGNIYLDLGEVSKVAEVWLNNQSLGITWTSPYRYDVTNIVKQGENELRIEIVNTWANRIIGDLTGTGKKYTTTNLTIRGTTELLWTETPLIKSGLFGPVTINSINEK